MAAGDDWVESNVVLVGLDPRQKQRSYATALALRSQGLSLERARFRLQQTRANAVTHLPQLAALFEREVSKRADSGVFAAECAVDAADYITRAAGRNALLALNNSSSLSELRTCLEGSGHTLLNTYMAGHQSHSGVEKLLNYYWQAPHVSFASGYESFSVQEMPPPQARKDYTAVLGVSAAAADDGSVFLLQHTSNIGTMLQDARRLIILVGLDKIVQTREEALFQARCMGAFGLESLILDMDLAGTPGEVAEVAASPSPDLPAETHVVLLDNGRRAIARSDALSELLTCIGCRACATRCPTHRYFPGVVGRYPRQYLWSFLIGASPSLDLCTGCGMCRADCPMGIDIPRMVCFARGKHHQGWHNSLQGRMLHDAWFLMRMASLAAPLANGLLRSARVRGLMESALGLQRDACLPEAKACTFTRWFRKHQPKKNRLEG